MNALFDCTHHNPLLYTMEATIVSALKKQLFCSICLKVYTDPKTLQCLHSFCLPCLNKMATESPQGTLLQCPECRTNIHLPSGATRFDAFPNSFYYKRLLEFLAIKNPQQASVRCGSCERNLSSVSFCFDCGDFICCECLSAHKVIKALKGHRFVALDELKDKDIEGLLVRPNCCPVSDHKHEALKFFCKDCKACICQRGALTEHSRHQFLTITKAAQECKAAVAEVVEKVKAQIHVVKEKRRKRDDSFKSAKRQIESVRQQVHDQVEYFIGMLKFHEAKVLSELDDVYNGEQSHYEAERSERGVQLAQLSSALEFVDGVSKRNLAAEIIYTHKWVIKRCTELATMKVEARKPRRFTIQYVTNRDYSVTTTHITPGRVVITGVTHDTTETQGLSAQGHPKGTEHECQALMTFGSKGHGKGKLSFPWGIAVNSRNEVAVADSGNHRIQIFSPDGCYLRCFGSQGTANGQMKFPQGLAFDEHDKVIVADSSNNRIQIFTTSGNFIKMLGENEIHLPWGVCVSDDRSIAVCSGGEKPGVKVFTQDGALLLQFNDRRRKNRPYYVAFGSEKYFVSYGNDHVLSVFNKMGRVLYTVGEHGDSHGQLVSPYGLLIDTRNNLLVCDFAKECIQIFTMDGQFVSNFGATKTGMLGNFHKPLDLAISHNGRLFVSENGANRVHVWKYT